LRCDIAETKPIQVAGRLLLILRLLVGKVIILTHLSITWAWTWIERPGLDDGDGVADV
jgi:hypothetical protein